ncbi:MAG: outer membrane protein assembly factor BamA [Pseudomonadota bacterium]
MSWSPTFSAQAQGLADSQLAQTAGDQIQTIIVEGEQRIDESTVLSYMDLRAGDPFDRSLIDESLKSLFATGLFADVVLRRRGNDLVVQVIENPLIAQIAFEGNESIEDDELELEVELRPRVVFTRTKAQNDVSRLLELYRRSGRFAATVEPKVIQLDQNRVNLVFEITEGPKTRVTQINFVGNDVFSDSDLRGEISTKESAWWRFLAAGDQYDQDRLDFDKDLLRRYYLRNGYVDFSVISAVAELTPDREEFFITFTVEEGERYRVGEISFETELETLNTDTLRDQLTFETGDWYNAGDVDDSIDLMLADLQDQQFAFADVRPRSERNTEERTVDLVFNVQEGSRVFVERIDINGNVRTIDSVIRRQMRLDEGDPFNRTLLQRSERSLSNLNYFETINVETLPGSAPDQTIIDVEVVEQSTGEISLGAGFSSFDGPLADFAIRERNFLGKGQDVRIAAQLSGRRQEFDLSFTEPFFLERDLSAGVDLFHVTTDFQDESSFDERTTGAGLRFGYNLGLDLRQNIRYRLETSEITDVSAGASRFIREQEGSRTVSLLGQDLTYDRRNSRLNPTDGYLLRLSTDVAGLGGDTRFLRGRALGSYYYPIANQVVLSATTEVGAIYGIGDDVNIQDRFFLGGETLRGFAQSGVGPRDIVTDDALGGNVFARGSLEMSLPIGLPEELGFLGHIFTDVGTLTDIDASGNDIVDESMPRVSVGVGLSWQSPFGPIRVDVALPVVKEDFDDTETFRFSFGARF